MSRFNHKHHVSRRVYLYRGLFLVMCIAFLYLFLPHTSHTKYQYRQGEPWDDNPLIAQDSFPILKSDSVLRRERDSLKRYYEPYFLWDRETGVKEASRLAEKFRDQLKGSVPAYYLPHLQEKLMYVYQQGIMDAEDYERLRTEGTRQIRVFQQNESQSRSVQHLFTEKTAYEYLMNEEDSLRYEHGKLMRCDLAVQLHCNLAYDVAKSQQQRSEVDAMLVPYIGQVLVGQKIVDRGQIVDETTFLILRSMERHNEERTLTTAEKLVRIGGEILYLSILMTLLFLYFAQFRSDYLQSMRIVLLVGLLVLFFPLLTYTLMAHSLMSVYVIPYCVLPLLIRIFMDSRTAFFTHLITVLLCAVALHHPYEFITTQVVAGLVTIYSLRQLSQRSELFRATILVIISTLLTYFCIDLLHGHVLDSQTFDRWTYFYLVAAGFLSMLSYLLLIPIERVFGFTSVVTMVELSNTNSEILRRLSEEAPGTFQHSMQVANLAAEVANRIGAKSQLVRTGALYHDIGKLENAAFFTENQSGTNPHDQLPYERSAQIIIQHVRAGLRLAEKYKLPPVIREFIATHHGKSMAKYFFVSWRNAHPNMPVDESLFTYPGPDPYTLEQAILMMADAVEAASRSLPEYTEESIGQMVDKIVDGQVSAGHFRRCPITFLEIEEAKDVFKAKLRTVYHTRIQYPEMK